MNPFRTGKLVLFQVSYDRDWHYFEIPFYIILGVFGVSYQYDVMRPISNAEYPLRLVFLGIIASFRAVTALSS